LVGSPRKCGWSAVQTKVLRSAHFIAIAASWQGETHIGTESVSDLPESDMFPNHAIVLVVLRLGSIMTKLRFCVMEKPLCS
jgi:hypothetical protein